MISISPERAYVTSYVINSKLGFISHRFQDTATYSLKHFIKNCGQTATDGDMVTIGSL